MTDAGVLSFFCSWLEGCRAVMLQFSGFYRVYVYVYIYVYTCIYIYTYTYTHIHIPFVYIPKPSTEQDPHNALGNGPPECTRKRHISTLMGF